MAILIYKKNGIFAQECGGIDSSCFKTDNPIKEFAKDGYTCEIVDDSVYNNLVLHNIDNIKNQKKALLSQYYSNDAWIVTVTYNGSIKSDKTRDWWCKEVSNIINGQAYNTNIVLSNPTITVQATQQICRIISKRGIEIGQLLWQAYENCKSDIEAFTDATLCQQYDFMVEFNKVDKTIQL